MGIKKLFGQNLKKYRKDIGLSQEELSEKLGLQTISRIETGNKFVSAKTIDKIVEVLKISHSELFNFDEPIPSNDRLAPILPYLNRLSDEDLEFFLASIKAFIKTRKN